MPLTVQGIIDQLGFEDFWVCGGKNGLKTREVKTVCVVDTIDIDGWVSGGEFLLSSGFIFKDNPEELGNLIETAHRYGAAALGVKVGRYIERIPNDVIKIADLLSFPLIATPYHYAHTEIINPVMSVIEDIRKKNDVISANIRNQFFEILLTGGSISQILEVLSSHIGRESFFIDSFTGERTRSGNLSSLKSLIEETPLSSITSRFPFEKIELNGKTRGYLFWEKNVSEEKSIVAILEAKRTLQLYLAWMSEKWKIEQGRDAQYIQDILYKRFRHDSEISNRGKALGWSFEGRQAVVILGTAEPNLTRIEPREPCLRAFEIFRSLLHEIQENIPHTTLDDSMVFIINAPAENWNGIKNTLSDIFTIAKQDVNMKTGLELVMGVGSPVENVSLCDRSFREAKRTLSLIKNGGIAPASSFWEEMGIYKLLAPIYNSSDATDFMNETLGALIKSSDSFRQDSLLQTLFCIIRNNWQLKPVASKMNMHYNTVKYRYRKIAEVLGKDLESPAVRINLSLAMELYILHKSERTGSDEKNI